MTQCQTINAGKLKLAAEKKEDESILIHIRDVDCVAAEVCYHRNCYMSYTNFLNFEVNDQPSVQLYDESFRIMCDQIVQKKIINDKEVMFMSKLYHEFKKIVSQTEGKDASNYRAFRLKQRLKNQFPQLVFHTPSHRNKSEFVFCEDLSVGSVIEESTITTNEIDDSDSELEDESCTPLKYQNLKDDSRTLFHAALILRKCITECPKFFTHWPPKIAEFSLENARSKIPAKLSNFLAWALNFSDEVIQNDVQIAIPEKDQLKVLSIAQDIIYVASRGNRQTPKALGLGMAVRQMTRSYQLTKILNGFGNAASHSAVLSLDTALAYKQLNSDVVIPNGIVKNTLTTMVWDNIDFREETATGFGTTHMTNGIIIQQQRNSSERPPSSDSAVPIKKSNAERQKRVSSGVQAISILSDKQRVPRQWKKFLGVGSNKESLIRFLVEYWQRSSPEAFKGIEVYATTANKCCSFKPNVESVMVEEVPSLESDHEEADTRMLLHAKHAAAHADTIIIKSPDTDVFVFAIACCLDIGANVLFETGTGNNQRRLSINSIATTLGSRWCKALIGFHMFTGR